MIQNVPVPKTQRNSFIFRFHLILNDNVKDVRRSHQQKLMTSFVIKLTFPAKHDDLFHSRKKYNCSVNPYRTEVRNTKTLPPVCSQ